MDETWSPSQVSKLLKILLYYHGRKLFAINIESDKVCTIDVAFVTVILYIYVVRQAQDAVG